MATRKKNPAMIDLFECEGQAERDLGANAFVALNKAMSAHYKRVKGVVLRDTKLYRREADMVREVVGLRPDESWDMASPDDLKMRRRLLNVLMACHEKNLGYVSRYDLLRKAKAILDIVDTNEF